MMDRCLVAFGLLSALLAPACSQDDGPFLPGGAEQRVVYGTDDRLEYYAHPDLVLRQRTAESVVAMIPPGDMDMSDPDDIQFTAPTLGAAWDLCAGQWFATQPTAAMCSGTLIDDDLVLTAGHCVTDAGDCAAYRWVFNYYYTAAGSLGPVTSADVFSCAELVAQEYTATVDYAIIRLDRPAPAPFAPAPVKLADTALAVDDPVAIIGFPSGIPAKLDSGGHVLDARAGTRDYFIATTDSFGGNSGSGVYDAARDLVGILVRGASDYVRQGGCYVVHVLPADGGGEGEDVTYVHNALDDLCNTVGWPSARLCGTPGDGWCDPCETPVDCPAGWSCQTWTGAPAVSFCAKPCGLPADCDAGHHCAAGGFCEPDLTTQCWDDDVWTYDSCMNRLWLDTDCAACTACAAGACVAALPGDSCACATVIPGASQTLTGSLSGYAADTTGTCAGAGPDRVFELTLTGQADLDVRSTGFDTVLYLRTACPPAGSQVECDDDSNPPGGTGSRITPDNLPPGTYYLFLDAYGSTVGDYTLTLTVTYDCQNTCAPGTRECSGAGWRACVITGNGCYNWGAVTACGAGETCVDGACVAACPEGDPCDDGSACTSGDVCAGGACGGAPVACDDLNPCTDDGCDPATGCTSSPNAAACDDGSDCTAGDVCAGGACGGTAVVCADGNGCTDDGCDPATGCAFLDNALPCDDGDPCTQGDACAAGVCVGGASICQCLSDADCAPFEDADLCNGSLVCQANQCVLDPASVVVCDPSGDTACRQARCDPATGACAPADLADGTPCDDGSACTAGDACAAGACAGAPVTCDDLNPCTDDGCDPATGCAFLDNNLPCDDGNPCTQGDACAAGVCVGGASTCQCLVDGDCAPFEDADLCNGSLVCQANLCALDPASVVVCDPSGDTACRQARCDPSTGACAPVDLADGTPCDDGSACTEGDGCLAGACQGAAVGCTAPDACHGAECDPLTGGCAYPALPDGAPCDDGNPCTEGDGCLAGACQAGANACTCQGDADCAAHEDGDVCNGTLVCQASQCVVDPATRVTCDPAGDGPCRRSVCAPATGVCAPEDRPDGEACDDGDACTTGDACESGACGGLGVDCSDGRRCTEDRCEPADGSCQSTPVADGTVCLGGTCQAGECVPDGDTDPDLVAVSGGGCACGASGSPAGVGLACLGLALAGLLRRRRR
ncbi:MAG TPA: serine protease [Myxococcota bacterium]|nr:serine protease [Myxococcota bacterium]